MIGETDIQILFEGGLHEFIDQLQVELADIHARVTQAWFDYA